MCCMGAQQDVEDWSLALDTGGANHLLSNGVHVRAQLAKGHTLVLRHHARPVELPQPLVRVSLRAEATSVSLT